MEKINTGIVNLIISNSLKNSYFDDESLIEESKKLANSYFDIVKESRILQLEFKVFDNIKNKHIENESEATRYIDNNIKLFETFTNEEIEEERQKLNSFINENKLKLSDGVENKIKLYNAINDLIYESLNEPTSVDINKMHESFTTILNHVRKPKQNIVENVEIEGINDNVIEIAIDKFNERYDKLLNEDDRNLLSHLMNYSDDKKIELLKEYKEDILNLLDNVDEKIDEKKLKNVKKKINEMNESIDGINDSIIDLHELKKGLI